MTSSSLYLEVEHCHQVCAELRTELGRVKADRVELAREVDEANERVAYAIAQRDMLVSVLELTDQFITNGIEFGRIRMPDADCPDPAHTMQKTIRAAINAAKGGAA